MDRNSTTNDKFDDALKPYLGEDFSRWNLGPELEFDIDSGRWEPIEKINGLDTYTPIGMPFAWGLAKGIAFGLIALVYMLRGGDR